MTRTNETEDLRIVVLLGSVRAERVGRHVATWVAERTRAVGQVDLVDLATVTLPDDAHLQPGGGRPTPLTERLGAADGFVVVTPEYNHAYPAAVKRVIDWHLTEWRFKPAALVGYGGQTGGALAAEALRGVFSELSVVTARQAVTVSRPWERLDPAFTADAGERRALDTALAELTWWADLLRTARRERPLPA